MDCDFDNDATTCPACGFIAGGRDWRMNCIRQKFDRKPGLGDLAAYALEHLGITKEKFSAFIGKECGCAARQEKLNRFGRYLKMRAEKLGVSLPL